MAQLASDMNYADLDACTRPSATTTFRPSRSRSAWPASCAVATTTSSFRRRARQQRQSSRKERAAGVYVEGLDDVMVRLSKCCTPVPGDDILGFVTRGRGVSVHRVDCSNAASFTAAAEGEARLIDVEWDRERPGVFMVSIEVLALDRTKLLLDVSRVLSEHHINILGSATGAGTDRISRMRFDIELADPSHLETLLAAIKRIDSVYDAYRVLPGRSG